jgi:hypothetical protein
MEIVVTDGEAFGDISRIGLASPSVAIPFSMDPKQPAADYPTIHQQDIQQALESLKQRGKGKRPPSTKNDLLSMLSTSGLVCHLPDQYIPRGLQAKILTKGTEVKLGHRSGIVKAELGRGAYGTVVLLGQNDKGSSAVALKIQTPTDSLALEYEILQKVKARVKKDVSTADPFPFPCPLSFISLSDGGLLSMSAGSKSGMNLVDLSNIYRTQERVALPELIAFHYTARMLKHMEVLHVQGNILVCKVLLD